MKFFGDVDVGDNSIYNVVINDDGAFQQTPKIGRLTFNGRRLYICADIINSNPIWVPLTNELTTHTSHIDTESTTWTLTHNLNTAYPVIQVYDDQNKAVIPDEITITSTKEAVVTFSRAIKGIAVCVTGAEEGVQKPNSTYIATVSVPTLATTVQHNLGYNPNVAIYSGGVMIMPSSITHNSLFSTSVAFTDPFTGEIRFT